MTAWDLLAAGVCARGKHDIHGEEDTRLIGDLRVCRGCEADMATERRAVRSTPDEGLPPPAPPEAPPAVPWLVVRRHILYMHQQGFNARQIGLTLGVTNACVRGVIHRYG
jgi:hypothetical protein